MTDTKKMEVIESWIDSDGLSSVLYIIGDICDEKAAHIQSSYSDDNLAEFWHDYGNRITELASSVHNDEEV